MPNPSKRKNSSHVAATEASSKNSSNGGQKARLRKELDTLHQEMEVARFATLDTGHRRRKVPKSQSKARTRQRKDLEKIDHEEIFAYDSPEEDVLIRGPAAAHTADVINGSLIFGVSGKQDEQQDLSGEDVSENQQSDDDLDYSSANENSENTGSEEDDEESEALVEEDAEDSDDDEMELLDETKDTSNSEDINHSLADNDGAVANDDVDGSGKKRRNKFQRMNRKRRRYRLRNFKSFRMAQRHGEALAAHARGFPALAIQKLKAIAHDHPSAPQVYSSLGMIYEEMLQDQKTKLSSTKSDYSTEEDCQDQKDESSPLISLATKMYGSFHVAAYLCTKDYALWERAANAAFEISILHSEIMARPDISNAVREYHRSAKVRWLSEAKSDYYRATKLNPPGIDVTCKLAATLVELGHLSEALTILTDLKNHVDKAPTFNASHGAWLLYADLMLRIGHECSKWNSGNQSNGDHMVRRWLRKMAKTFNWQERRLQALVKALEAAAGSTNCSALLNWMQQRALSMNSTKDHGPHVSSGSEDITHADIETEKQILMKRNSEELEDFDRVTLEMKSGVDLKSDQARRRERENLLETQMSRIESLNQQANMTLDEGLSGPSFQEVLTRIDLEDATGVKLPPSASCRTVCSIAIDLVRHALSTGATIGGKLACESVSSYFKERSALIEKRIAARKTGLQEKDNLGDGIRFHQQSYDIIGDLSDGNTSDVAFSDDDELTSSDTPDLLKSLQYGSLPPTLRFLYGVCLAAEGGKRFLAMRCIESVNSIEQEALDWLNEDICDTSAVLDTSWQVLLKCTTSPLTRTMAYSLLGDILKKGSLDIPIYEVSRLLSEHVNYLIGSGTVEEALGGQSKNPLQSRRRRLVIDVLVTAARFQLQHVEDTMAKSSETDKTRSRELVIDLLDSLTTYLGALWSVDSSAAICSSCMEILSVLAASVRLLLAFEEDFHEGELQKVILKIEMAISILSDVSCFESCRHNSFPLENLESVPFTHSFQSEELKRISLRAHNCAVATNCSHFSGWESAEFSTALLKSVDIPYFSGISVEDNLTFGILNNCWVPVLSRQWDRLPTLLPNFRGFDFAAHFKAVSTGRRYAEVRKSMEEATKRNKICIYGEDNCIDILLSYSEFSLRLASITKDRGLSSRMSCTALSVILPLSQFALHREIWTSALGKVAASQTGLIEWRPLATRTVGTNSSSYLLPTESRGKEDSMESSLDQWFEWESDKSPLSNLVPLTPGILLSSWTINTEKIPAPSADGALAMQQLDEALRQLRMCFSEQAIEIQSLNVAAKLLQVASSTDCQNPFLCISQAARFARHSRKGGTSSDVFKFPLGPEAECTSWDVIGVLGRAGCLQSLYCFHEAAFLYSYVAGVCAAHRNADMPFLDWNDHWKALSIFTYNQTVRLRASFRALVKEHGTKDEQLFVWKTNVVEELKAAKSDGSVLVQSQNEGYRAPVAQIFTTTEEHEKQVQLLRDYGLDFTSSDAMDADNFKETNGEATPEVVAV